MRSTDCPLASDDAAAVIAILAGATPRVSAGGNLPLDTQVRIRARSGAEIVATLPPPDVPEPDGAFAIAIAAGVEGRFYRLDADGLARIGRIAVATGCN